ncbi:MAG: hypothetical protein ABFR50_11890, partial [Candidatus Fermentibacteria bacterium]
MIPFRKNLNSGLLLIILIGSLAAAILVRVFLTDAASLVEMRKRTPVLGTFATYIVIDDTQTAGL